MEEKIKLYLGILDNLDFDVKFFEDCGSGVVTLRHHCVTCTFLDLLTKAVNLVAIDCPSPDCYNITFISK